MQLLQLSVLFGTVLSHTFCVESYAECRTVPIVPFPRFLSVGAINFAAI